MSHKQKGADVATSPPVRRTDVPAEGRVGTSVYAVPFVLCGRLALHWSRHRRAIAVDAVACASAVTAASHRCSTPASADEIGALSRAGIMCLRCGVRRLLRLAARRPSRATKEGSHDRASRQSGDSAALPVDCEDIGDK